MSQLCTVPTCTELVFASCNCCSQHLCKLHLSEHYEYLHDRLNVFGQEIRRLNDGLTSFNIHPNTMEAREKLVRWRADCHRKIDALFERKSHELDQYMARKIDKQAQEIEQVQARLARLVEEQTTTRKDIDSLSWSLDRLQEDMVRIEQTYVHLNARPLLVADDALPMVDTVRPPIDLTKLSPPYKILEQPGKSPSVLASNEQSLLVHDGSHLCVMDQELKAVQQAQWPFEGIVDMCWSSTLDRFLLISANELYLVGRTILLITRIPTLQSLTWSSCTCSETSLFLTNNEQSATIMEFHLLPTMDLSRTWQSPDTCERHEHVNRVVCNKDTLALIIRNPSDKTLRIELRFSATLDCLWSLPLEVTCNPKGTLPCCSLSFDEWLITDGQSDRLLHVTKCGQLKTIIPYSTSLYSTHLFNQNILVVLSKTGKNFHRLT